MKKEGRNCKPRCQLELTAPSLPPYELTRAKILVRLTAAPAPRAQTDCFCSSLPIRSGLYKNLNFMKINVIILAFRSFEETGNIQLRSLQTFFFRFRENALINNS